jgi:hypothetical protein
MSMNAVFESVMTPEFNLLVDASSYFFYLLLSLLLFSIFK